MPPRRPTIRHTSRCARESDAILVLTAIPELYPLHGEPRYRQLLRRAVWRWHHAPWGYR